MCWCSLCGDVGRMLALISDLSGFRWVREQMFESAYVRLSCVVLIGLISE